MIHLWYVRFDAAAREELLARYRAMLPPDEQAEEARLRLQTVRRQLLISRALVREALSDATGVPPDDWRFARGLHGKPAVCAPQGVAPHFNLSHTHGMAVCAVSRSGVVGVDVEAVSRDTDLAGLAQRFFAPPEAAAVAAASGLEQREAFFRFWTLKEAYMKARGLGLSLPLDSYAFTLSPAAPPRLTVLQEVARSPEDWQFAELTLDDYRIAVAAETRSSEPFRLRLRETVPLVSAEPWRELPVNETHRWTL